MKDTSKKVTLYIATHNKTGLKYFGKTQKYFTEEALQEKDDKGVSIYDKTAKKVSKTRKKLGLSKGSKNCKAKTIGIFDENNCLIYLCYGNFHEMCEKHDLPIVALKKTRLTKSKGLYMTKMAKGMVKGTKNEKYTGWYSREITL